MTLGFAPETIESWPLERLRPYAQNAKTHGPDQVARIAASIAEFGWTVPVLVADDGEIIAGHGRILAATELGLGDLWILGDHRLLCGDSTKREDVRRLMNGERAVLFASDPPYLVDYDGSNHPTRNKDWSQSYGVTWDDSSQGAELYDGFISTAVAEAITENAAWYCWHASRRQAMLEACWEKAGAFVHQQIIWVKDRGVLTRSHYLWKHEPCFMGWRRPHRPPKVADETLSSTWPLPSFHRDDRPDHPTPKPLDCFGIPMRQHVPRGGLCYEPFSGSGSQIMAGEANGRRVYAMEISPAYVDVAVERWQTETGRGAVLDGDRRSFAEVRQERIGAEPAQSPEEVAA